MSSKNKKRSKIQRSRANEQSQKTSLMDDSTVVEKRSRKCILPFVERTLEAKVEGLTKDFNSMKRGNDFTKMKAFKEAQEHGKNRYKDVGCLDNNRVKLGSPWPHDYIHANYVAVPSNPKRFICTQAPLDKTCADFWFMCLQEQVENIFMLCNLVEKGAKKCAEYYPSEEKQETLTFKEKNQSVSVKFVSTSMVKFSDSSAKVMKTVLKVEGAGGLALKTNHYHWIDWPDRGVPTADQALLELLAKARVSKTPIVVHCSAGIGRTGSVVMIEYIMDQMLSGKDISTSRDIITSIRTQRNNSIQTDHQYIFVHQVLLNYIRAKKWIENEIVAYHDQFTEDYTKVLN